MSALKVTTRDAPTGPVLKIVGDLDYHTAGELRARITTLTLQPGRRLVVDLGDMEYCDSSGITALIVVRNHALAADADVALAAVPDHTLRVLRIVGLDQIFALHPRPRRRRPPLTAGSGARDRRVRPRRQAGALTGEPPPPSGRRNPASRKTAPPRAAAYRPYDGRRGGRPRASSARRIRDGPLGAVCDASFPHRSPPGVAGPHARALPAPPLGTGAGPLPGRWTAATVTARRCPGWHVSTRVTGVPVRARTRTVHRSDLPGVWS